MTRLQSIFPIAALAALIIASPGCGTKQQEAGNADHSETRQARPSADTPPPATQDVSTEALIKIDPEIRKYDDAVLAARKAFDAGAGKAARSALIDAYMRFGDYMQYESPVSPRKGKYRRALMEYRHALKLDPMNEKAQREIGQIEDIYRSMNRPVPGDEEA